MPKNILVKDIQKGLITEGQRIEFKENWSSIAREIVAFANGGGGHVFIGINDQGQITKQFKATNKVLSQIQDLIRNLDPSSIKCKIVKHSEYLLEIIVEEGVDGPYRCKEGFFLRIGPNSQKLKRNEIIDLINYYGQYRFDEEINNSFNFTKDFDNERFKHYISLTNINHRSISPKNFLLGLELAREEKRSLRN